MNFKKLLKITVSRQYGWKFNICTIWVSFNNITPWHVHSFAYDRFNWRDGIWYSYISFSAKSQSISLVDFWVDISPKDCLQSLGKVDMLLRKNIFGKSFQLELKFICAEFQIFFNI